ncbi:unnamed protein product [Angiostrongylus costaricensis]|uniref:NADH dehydrogenase [ubiquinone] 1 subunit C2 n=1 Tax=Angiostrongylus costaricensis TaxID=334426 RepID=A0A0R3PXA1_ANGCS|nr:unnamed protein product [Angiostrongylus costaricensis]
MPSDIHVPPTTYERLKKHQKEFSTALRHPDSPEWFNKEYNEKLKKELLWAAPYDARFPQVRKERQCFAYYVDFHRCNELMGKDYKPCKFFQNVYKMAESTRASPEEIERREKYLRAELREMNPVDPFTWSYPMKLSYSFFMILFNKICMKVMWSSSIVANREFRIRTRFQGAGVLVGLSLVSTHLYNIWYKKPYYFAIFPRLIATGVMGALGYGLGSLREHHYKTRDAVVQHYIELHPQDFDHFNDRNGRPFSEVLLPWYPRRAQYTKY